MNVTEFRASTKSAPGASVVPFVNVNSMPAVNDSPDKSSGSAPMFFSSRYSSSSPSMKPSIGGLCMISLNTRFVRIAATLSTGLGAGVKAAGGDHSLQRPVLSLWRTRARYNCPGTTENSGKVRVVLNAGSSGESHAASYSSFNSVRLLATRFVGCTAAMRHCIAAKVPTPCGSENVEDWKVSPFAGKFVAPV